MIILPVSACVYKCGFTKLFIYTFYSFTNQLPLNHTIESIIITLVTSGVTEWVKVAQSCLTLCDPMDYTVHGILQARILEWVAFSFSRGSSQPRDRTQVSHIAGRFFTSWVIREWILENRLILSPGDLPDPGIVQGSPALQVDSLPTELSEKPGHLWNGILITGERVLEEDCFVA